MNNEKKNIILSIVVILVGLLLAGGTYAFLSSTITITNNIVNGSTTCFDIDYIDNTDQITGALFPSSGPEKGLRGSISLKVNDSCDINGVGNIYIHVNSGTSNLFTTTVSEHCENKDTLETLYDYQKSDNCTKGTGSSNRRWVTNGTPLKYAVYDNSMGTGTPLSVGYINEINSDITVYKDFVITHTQKDFYIFLWLDGWHFGNSNVMNYANGIMTFYSFDDNIYTNLSFDGYVKADAIQTRTVYTAVTDQVIRIGQPMPSNETEYNTPQAAMTALTAYAADEYGYTYIPFVPFFLKHIVSNNVVKSYVGFVVTPEMVAANPKMTAGTYYIQGGDIVSFLDNAKTIYDAFGGEGCNVNPYTTTNFNSIECSILDMINDDELYIYLDNNYVTVGESKSSVACEVGKYGSSCI